MPQKRSSFVRQELIMLSGAHEPPCVTLTMPVHRLPPELARTNPVELRKLVKQAAIELESRLGPADPAVADLTRRLETLGGDLPSVEGEQAWASIGDGLAVFAARDHLSWYGVPMALPAAVHVGEGFQVRSLLPLLVEDERFRVLTLTENEVGLWEGSRAGMARVPLAGVPEDLVEVLGERVIKRRDLARHGSGPMAAQMTHGYGRGSEEDRKGELRKYFRAVDRAITEHYSKPSPLPLIPCAVEYYLPLYREVSHDTTLMSEGIALDPGGLSAEQLHAEALKVLEPLRERRVAQALDQLGTAHAHGKGAVELQDVSQAAAAGRVWFLLLEEGRREMGSRDPVSGSVRISARPGPADVDVLEDIAEAVLLTGGDVLLVPPGRLPAPAGAAAVLRY